VTADAAARGGPRRALRRAPRGSGGRRGRLYHHI